MQQKFPRANLLNRRRFLGHAAPKETSSIAWRIRKEGEQGIKGTGVDPNYQAKELRNSAEPNNA